jgi:hypothetical protein
MQSPRNLREWQQAVERRLAASKNGTQIAIARGKEEADQVREETNNFKNLTPAAPVEIVYGTSIYIDANKRRRGKVTADFPDVVFATNGDPIGIGNYEISGQDQGLNPLEGFQSLGLASQSSIIIAGLNPGSTWKFRIRALNGTTVKPGLWSEEATVTITADTTPPPQPSAPVVTANGGSLTVKWDGLAAGGGVMPADFDHVEVAFGLASSPTAKLTDFYAADFDVVPKSAYNVPHYFRFRAYDTSGNVSGWSAQASGIPVPLVDTDVILSHIDAAETEITNIGAASILTGAITTAKLADNAITQVKLQDQIISLAKMDTSAQTKIQKGIDDAATAQTAANTANTAAGTAQTAADKAQSVVDAKIAAGANLIVNGGFDATPITNPALGFASRQLAVVQASSTTARSGANILKCSPTGSSANVFSLPVASSVGRVFYVEYWVRLDQALLAGNENLLLGVYVGQTNTAGTTVNNPVYGSSSPGAAYPQVKLSQLSTTAWTKFAQVITVTQADNVSVKFGLRIPSLIAMGNTFEVDDFRAVDMTEAQAALDAAAAAQAKADSAFTDAQSALTNAGLAQTAANGKNSVYYTGTAPAGSGFKTNDIWFRSSDNKLHMWDGDSWEPRADTAIATAQSAANAASAAASTADGKAVAAQTAADNAATAGANAQTTANSAASAAATADTKAVNAQTKANKAETDAANAQTAANNAATAASTADTKAVNAQTAATNAGTAASNAQTSANNAATLANSIVKTSTSAATGTPPSVGALWNQTNAAGDLIIKTWTANTAGTAWVERKLDDAVIGNLNAATINAGIIAAARFNAADIRAKFIEAGKITAADIVANTLTSASGIFGTMDASVLNAGTLNAARLSAGDVRAKFLSAGLITASDIVASSLTSASGIFGTMDASVLNAGTLNAARLNAGDIRAKFLTAGLITANDIVASTLTSASGVFGTMDASVLNAGTLNAARLNAGDVRAKFLAAGKVTAADMVTNTITAASGIIAELDLGKATVGELDGIYVKAKSLRSSSLLVTDLVNFAPPLADLTLPDTGDWTLSGGMTIISSALDSSGKRFHVTDNTGTAWARGPFVAVKPGDKLYASARVYRNGAATNSAFLRYEYFDKDKVAAGTPTYTGTQTNAGSGARMEWVATVPSGIAYARLALPVVTASPTTGVSTGFYEVYGYKQTPSVIIEDGAVTADKVAANAIEARHIIVGDFANIALGSDFEDANAVPWTLASTHTITTSQKKSGTSSLRLAATTGTKTSTLTADTRVKEGEQWYFKFHAYIDASFNGTAANSKLRVGKQDGTLIGAMSFESITRSAWTTVPLEMALTIPAGTTSLVVDLMSDNTAGTAYIDDIQVRRMSEASLIQNLGVEKLTASTANISQAVVDKIYADVVRSRRMSTDMLTVGRGINGIFDEFFDAADIKTFRNTAAGAWGSWGTSAGTLLNTYGNTSLPGTTSRSFYWDTLASYDKNSYIPVEPGQVWRLSMQYNSAVSGPRATVRYVKRDGTSAYTSIGWTKKDGTTNSYGAPGTNQILERVFTVPADVTHIMPAVQFETTCTSATVFGGATFTNMATSSLIVDGGIATRHLTVTEDMTVKLLAAHKVEASEIDTNDLTADTGFISSMRTNILTADVISATNIGANAITSKHTITGATFQTSALANTGIKWSSTGILAYDSGNQEVLNLSASTGAITGTGTWRTGRSGNYINMLATAQGGMLQFFTGNGTGRGSIWARDVSPEPRMSLAYSNVDEPSGTLPVVVVTPTKSYLNYGSRNIMCWNNGGVEELLLDATGASIVARGNLDMRDGRIQLRYGSAVPLGYVGQAPASGSTPDMEVRADAGKLRLVGNITSLTTFNTTTTSAANMFIDSGGNLLRSSSAARYKVDQRPLEVPATALDVKLKDWVDRGAMERKAEMDALPRPFTENAARDYDAINLDRIPGLIAEDLEAAGMHQFVVYGPDGQTEGVMYERFAFAQIDALLGRLEELEAKVAELSARL